MRVRLPRVRSTVRRLLVVVALLAILLFVGAMLTRPYPSAGIPGEGTYEVVWSDGSVTRYPGNDRPFADARRFGPFLVIRWKDGSYTLRLITSEVEPE